MKYIGQISEQKKDLVHIKIHRVVRSYRVVITYTERLLRKRPVLLTSNCTFKGIIMQYMISVATCKIIPLEIYTQWLHSSQVKNQGPSHGATKLRSSENLSVRASRPA